MRRISSFIIALYLLATGTAARGQGTDPDALYRQREDMAAASQALDVWAARLAATPTDYESAWKLARASYWIGTHAASDRRRAALDRGVSAGQQAAALQPDRPEGHFWLAASMGALAESYGLTQGIKYRGRIKNELQRVLAMDPGWQQGSADRALGWWYHRVPGLFGGSEAEAEAHLRRALSYNPQSPATLYFLSEVLIERGKRTEARATLQATLDAPIEADWAPEDRDFQKKAADQLRTLDH